MKGGFCSAFFSPRTEEAYLHRIRELLRFHPRRHPRDMGAAEITTFLNDLAVKRRTAASTQNQALCAVVFLYRRVLELPLPDLDAPVRAMPPEHLPAVLSRPVVPAAVEPPRQRTPLRRHRCSKVGARKPR